MESLRESVLWLEELDSPVLCVGKLSGAESCRICGGMGDLGNSDQPAGVGGTGPSCVPRCGGRLVGAAVVSTSLFSGDCIDLTPWISSFELDRDVLATLAERPLLAGGIGGGGGKGIPGVQFDCPGWATGCRWPITPAEADLCADGGAGGGGAGGKSIVFLFARFDATGNERLHNVSKNHSNAVNIVSRLRLGQIPTTTPRGGCKSKNISSVLMQSINPPIGPFCRFSSRRQRR